MYRHDDSQKYSRGIELMIDIHTVEASTWWYDYHQVDTSPVSMTIINSIPLLYVWLSSSQYLCCIYDYHQVDTSPVSMTSIKSIPLLYWCLKSSRYHCCIYIYRQFDTSAVLMHIIKSIPLLYWWLSLSRYLCCIYDYHQVVSHKYSRGIDLIIVINTAEVLTWW
jgi:hypothetical protein